MDKEEFTPLVKSPGVLIWSRFYLAHTEELDPNVQELAYRPQILLIAAALQRTAVLNNSLVFFLFSPVLSRGGGFDIREI